MVTTLASVVSLCIVAYTAWIAKASLESAKKDSKMRSRPMMYARFAETPLAGMGRYDLVIGNAGPSVARNVSVTFDPPGLVLSDSNKEPKAANHIIKRYKDPIPNWVPEEVAHNVYFVGDDQPRRENKEPLPDKLTVYLQYENDEFVRKRFLIFSSGDRKSTRLNSSHVAISYAVFCLKKKINKKNTQK